MVKLCCTIGTPDVPYIEKFVSTYLPGDTSFSRYTQETTDFAQHLEEGILFQVKCGKPSTWVYVPKVASEDMLCSVLEESLLVPIEFFKDPTPFPELLVLL